MLAFSAISVASFGELQVGGFVFLLGMSEKFYSSGRLVFPSGVQMAAAQYHMLAIFNAQLTRPPMGLDVLRAFEQKRDPLDEEERAKLQVSSLSLCC